MTYLSRHTRYLHWIIAVMMIMLFVVGQIMEDMEGPEKYQLARTHGSVGMTVFFLGLWRLVHRLREGFPEAIGHQPKVLDIIAKIVHWILLLAPIVLPISGLMIFLSSGGPITYFGMEVFGGSGVKNGALHEIGEAMHETWTKLFFVALILHVAGALKHHFIDKDNTLTRMLGFGSK